MIVPEVILLESIKGILKYVREDFTNQPNEQDTFLFRLFQQLALQRYVMFEEVKEVVISDPSSPRFLDVNLFFNSDRANLPTIHIVMNNESQNESPVGIGHQFPNDTSVDNIEREIFEIKNEASFALVVTSNNTNEVVMLYHLLKAFCISLRNHFEISGLHNIRLSGNDVPIDTSLVPPGIFGRKLDVRFEYFVKSLSLDIVYLRNFINFIPQIINT